MVALRVKGNKISVMRIMSQVTAGKSDGTTLN